MQNVELVVTNIGQLATCSSPKGAKRAAAMLDVGLMQNAAAAIADGKFIAVGPQQEIAAEYLSENEIDAGGFAVVPGLVDPHTHIVYAGDRLDEFELKIKGAAYLDILTAGGGIVSTVTQTRAASVEELVRSASTRLDRMLACGTTVCEIKTGYGLDLATELKMLAVIEELDRAHAVDIVRTLLAAHATPPEFKENLNGYVDLICHRILPEAWRWFASSDLHGRVPFFCDVFCEKGAYSLEQSRTVLETARGLGYEIKAHVEQFTALGGSRMAIELDAASVDHLDAITDEEVGLLAASSTVGVVIPTENFSAGKTQFADARKLIDAGCAVAVSTDYNPGSAPCPSQQMAMAIACRYQKLLPAEALNAVTINAAHAIGMAKTHGSIEPGKSADLVITDCRDYRELAYEFGITRARQVIAAGKLVC